MVSLCWGREGGRGEAWSQNSWGQSLIGRSGPHPVYQVTVSGQGAHPADPPVSLLSLGEEIRIPSSSLVKFENCLWAAMFTFSGGASQGSSLLWSLAEVPLPAPLCPLLCLSWVPGPRPPLEPGCTPGCQPESHQALEVSSQTPRVPSPCLLLVVMRFPNVDWVHRRPASGGRVDCGPGPQNPGAMGLPPVGWTVPRSVDSHGLWASSKSSSSTGSRVLDLYSPPSS